MAKITKRSRVKREILDCLSVYGEISIGAMNIIRRGKTGTFYNAVNQMKEYGWIDKNQTRIKSENQKRKRTREKMRYTLCNPNNKYEEYGRYVSGTKEDYKEGYRQITYGQTVEKNTKRLSASEIVALMYNIGLKINEYPKDLSKSEQGYYLISRYIKKELENNDYKIEDEIESTAFSTMTGIISMPEKSIAVYDIGSKERMSIHSYPESVMHLFINKIRGIDELKNETERIFIVNDYSKIDSLMYSTWSIRIEEAGRWKKAYKTMLDGWHSKTYCITKSEEGEAQLDLIVYEDEREISQIFAKEKGYKPYHNSLSIKCDGYEDNAYHIQAFAGELTKIKMFLSASSLYPEKDFVIHCFKELADALNELELPDNVKIETEEINKWLGLIKF